MFNFNKKDKIDVKLITVKKNTVYGQQSSNEV